MCACPAAWIFRVSYDEEVQGNIRYEGERLSALQKNGVCPKRSAGQLMIMAFRRTRHSRGRLRPCTALRRAPIGNIRHPLSFVQKLTRLTAIFSD